MRLKQKFIYKNSSNNKIKLMLEPWGEKYSVESDSEVKIISESYL